MEKVAIKGVLFDLDGTLLYTLEDIRASVNVPLANRGLELITIEECRKNVGNGLKNTIKGCFLDRGYIANEKELDIALSELHEYYNQNPAKYSKPYERIIDFLQDIKIPFGILSNKDDKIVQQIIPIVFPKINFNFISGAKNDILKPSPKSVIAFCNQENINTKNLLYVGDSEVDYNTAVNSNCQAALVTWGYRDREELIKFDSLIVDTVDQLRRIINGN